MHKFCALFLVTISLTFTSCETLPSSSQNVGIIFYKDDIFIPTDFQLSYLTSTLSNLKYTEDINHFYEEKIPTCLWEFFCFINGSAYHLQNGIWAVILP